MPYKDPEKRKAFHQAYYQSHKEKWEEQRVIHHEAIKARKRNYHHAHKEEISHKRHEKNKVNPLPNRLRVQKWAQAYPERVKQQHAEYYAAHREEQKRKGHERYLTNKEKESFKRTQREYAEKCREKRLVYYSQWSKKNRDKRYTVDKRRRAQKYNAALSDFTEEQWKNLKELYQYHCAYCGKHTERLTQDHVIPLSKGGNHTLSNIVPACRPCNSRKHTSIWVPNPPPARNETSA